MPNSPARAERGLCLPLVLCAPLLGCGAASLCTASNVVVTPQPPGGLDARLESFYPMRQRKVGAPGMADVRFTVLRNGQLRDLAVVRASAPSFGKACVQMLEQTLWEPALNYYRKPIDFPIDHFHCVFLVAWGDAPPPHAHLAPDIAAILLVAANDALDECIPAAADASARLSIRARFDKRGNATSAELVESSLPDAANRCVLQYARNWVIPFRVKHPADFVVRIR